MSMPEEYNRLLERGRLLNKIRTAKNRAKRYRKKLRGKK